MGFVFGSFTGGSPSVNNDVYLMNCPLPIQQNINTTTVTISNNQVVYTALPYGTHINNVTGVGTYFQCSVVSIPSQGNPNPPPLPFLVTTPRDYGQTVAAFPVGWFQYVADAISIIAQKIVISIHLAYTFFTTPADVSGIVWFNLITAILLLLFTIGIFMIVRGGGG